MPNPGHSIWSAVLLMSWYFNMEILVQIIPSYEVQVHCVRPLTEPTAPSPWSRIGISMCRGSNCSGKALHMGDRCNTPFPRTLPLYITAESDGAEPEKIEVRREVRRTTWVARPLHRDVIITFCACERAPSLWLAYPFMLFQAEGRVLVFTTYSAGPTWISRHFQLRYIRIWKLRQRMAQRNQNDEQGEVCENRQLHTPVLETVCLGGWLFFSSMNNGE